MLDMRRSTRWRPALLALALVALAGPAHAQTNPVHVADLVNLPIVDESKSELGRVRAVVQTDDGKVQLLLPLGGLLGFGERLVPVPIESVALAGPQIVVVEMPSDRFQKSPTWYGSGSKALAAADTISIARR